MTLVQRLWIYQRERFPLLSHSLLVAALTVGASGFASAGDSWPPLARMTGAFAVALGFFLLLRIADEFKDAADDAAYRPYRPVPRGLVTLRELAAVGIVVLLLQFSITLLLGWELLPYLLAAWLVLLLMSREFFVAEWLRARPVVYMLSHMLILPLIDLNLLAAARQGGEPSAAWGWFLVTTYTNGIVFEVGRKIRAKEDEEVGVETYSALWGVPSATAVWLLAVGIAGASGIVAGWSVSQDVGIRGAMALIFVCGWMAAAWAGWRMTKQPSSGKSRWIERLSGLWVLAFYLSLGLLPHWG
ncbi:MAG: UbiA family prenyltransferase [Caldilineaceae bacterium]|nr:UbiA family prenyltransferase [Caldilineaceae bacterium]